MILFFVPRLVLGSQPFCTLHGSLKKRNDFFFLYVDNRDVLDNSSGIYRTIHILRVIILPCSCQFRQLNSKCEEMLNTYSCHCY